MVRRCRHVGQRRRSQRAAVRVTRRKTAVAGCVALRWAGAVDGLPISVCRRRRTFASTLCCVCWRGIRTSAASIADNAPESSSPRRLNRRPPPSSSLTADAAVKGSRGPVTASACSSIAGQSGGSAVPPGAGRPTRDAVSYFENHGGYVVTGIAGGEQAGPTGPRTVRRVPSTRRAGSPAPGCRRARGDGCGARPSVARGRAGPGAVVRRVRGQVREGDLCRMLTPV